MIVELQLEAIALRDLLKQMLNVAENCDETGYCTDIGFVDIGALHEKVRDALTRKESQSWGDDQVMRQHLSEGGTPT